jgi:CheY-like chemotaxis protein
VRTLPLIVVIEPEWPTRSYLRAELEELGYEVLVFETPSEAERALARWGFQPSLFLVDLSRDGSSLLPVSELLAQSHEAPLVLITSPLRALPAPLQSRAARILPRPVSVHEVVRAVTQLVPPPFNER